MAHISAARRTRIACVDLFVLLPCKPLLGLKAKRFERFGAG
jgi:hypothetical protein